MSHELRTPLSVITGYTDLLLEEDFGPLTPEQTTTLERVQTNAFELLDLINATLDMSRLEGGRLPMHWSTAALSDFVRDLAGEMRGLQEQTGLNFTWTVARDLPIVTTDAVKLKVVLKNLISNAAKFTERGTVAVGLRRCGDGVEISVSDTGIGIGADVLPIIFEPFRQGDSSYTRRYGGVGLGLYIVRRLLDLLGGSVAVESKPGRGSTFRVWIPTGNRALSRDEAI
jgi:signal transduction histidine kinase